MSYLTSYAKRNPTVRGRGVDEKIALNLQGFHGGAYVRVFVEDTTFRKWRRRPPQPRIRLRIADCSREILLWFELDSPEARENSLYKINTLLGALQRFRDALDAEAELYAHRAQHRPRKEVTAR
jgi:hypothetical protein